VSFDSVTKIVSIKKTFSSKTMFNNKYPYRTYMYKTKKTSFKNLTDIIKKKFKTKKILEIGSNDGSFLKNFNKKETIGIEPCANVEKITKKMKFNTIPEYWGNNLAKKILKKFNDNNFILSHKNGYKIN